MKKISENVNNQVKNQVLMGIALLVIVSMIALKLPSLILGGSVRKETLSELTENKSEEKTTNVNKNSAPLVIIDPGHGGIDPGKIGVNDKLEKDINLEIANRLKVILEKNGYKTVMTRTNDDGLYSQYDSNKKQADMWVRKNTINMHHENNEKAICISVHQNSYSDSSVKGPQVFYYEKSEHGDELAGIIQNAMNLGLGVASARTATDNDSYYVLLHTTCPTVIVECGFLSNWEEAQMLSEEWYQEKVAQTIYEGIVQFYEKY